MEEVIDSSEKGQIWAKPEEAEESRDDSLPEQVESEVMVFEQQFVVQEAGSDHLYICSAR